MPNGLSGPTTIKDGKDVTQGSIGDAMVAGGASGTESAKLRRLTNDLAAILARDDLTDSQLVTALLAGLVAATLSVNVENFPATQPVSAAALPLPAGAATETTLASVLAKLSADPATQATLAAVLAKLSADPATQATLAAVLAKISSDPATQATLAAVLTELTTLAAGSTLAAIAAAVAGLEGVGSKTLSDIVTALGSVGIAGNVNVGNFPADQLVHAASLPLPAGAATQTTLASVLTALSGTVAVDASGHAVPVTNAGLTNLDLATSALRDALRGGNNKTLSDLVTLLAGGLPAALDGTSLKVAGGGKTFSDVVTALAALVLPATLGQKSMANSLAVALASDQSALAVTLSQLAAAATLSDALANPSTTQVGTNLLVWDGSQWQRVRMQSKVVDLNTLTITTIQTAWTPANGKKIRLMGGSISVSAAASVLFEDNAGGATVWRTPVCAANVPHNFDLGNGKLLALANNVLKVTGSAACAVTGTLYGCEE